MDDDSQMGLEVYYENPLDGQGGINTLQMACPVRKPTRKPLANFLRFQFDLPANLSSHFTRWVYGPGENLGTHNLYGTNNSGTDKSVALVQEVIGLTSTPLKKVKLCAHWFILRRFRIKDTVATAELMQNG